jgi:hypothetical protein
MWHDLVLMLTFFFTVLRQKNLSCEEKKTLAIVASVFLAQESLPNKGFFVLG